MLGTLLVLAAGAAVLAVTHLAASWVIIPPAAMLAGFLVLLREAANTDAERARRAGQATGTAAHETTTAAPVGAGLNAPAAGEGIAPAREPRVSAASWAEPSAQVIDLSGRIHDQLYDQYTDAAERAVGD